MPLYLRKNVSGKLALGATLAAAALTLAGCSSAASGPSSTASGTGASTAKSSQATSISYLYFTNGPDLAATKTLISEFEKASGITVNLQVVPYANLNQVLQGRVSAGDPPDVVQTSDPATFGNDLVDLGAALGPNWVKTINKNVLGSGLYNGKIVGLPNQLTVMGAFVNVPMFNKAGVPVPTATTKWTWPQLVAAAKKVQAANKTPFAISIDHSGSRVANVLCQFGAYLFGTSGTGTWDQTAATNGMTTLSGLIKSNVISKDAWIAAGTKYAAGDTQFLAGQTPVLLSGSWEVASFAKNAPFKWVAAPNPCGTECGGMSGGNYMVAFKKAKNPTAATKFIEFMSSAKSQAYMSVASATIPSAVALSAPGAIHYDANIQGDMDVFNQAAALMPAACNQSEANAGFTQASLELMNQLTAVVAGQTSVSAAVADVTKVVQQINAKSGS